MNKPKRPKRWQLDVFMLLMIVLMLQLMQAHLSSSWEAAAESAWCVLTLMGMGLWVCDNWTELQHEQQQTQRKREAPDGDVPPESRSIPLTLTQRRFLAATQRHTKNRE